MCDSPVAICRISAYSVHFATLPSGGKAFRSWLIDLDDGDGNEGYARDVSPLLGRSRVVPVAFRVTDGTIQAAPIAHPRRTMASPAL